MVKITVVGSLNYDLVTYTTRIPGPGETFQANSFETHIGGKGLNQTIAIAKLNPDNVHFVRMVGNVGDDGFGKELVDAMKDVGVDTDDVVINEGISSGVATILVESNTGENRILITSGANGKSQYTPDDLARIFPISDQKEVVVFQHEIPGSISIIKWLNSNRSETEIVYNPSPYQSYAAEVNGLIDVLIVNEVESLAIAKDTLPTDDFIHFQEIIEKDPIDGYSQLAKKLRKEIRKTYSSTVIITLGSLGTVYMSSQASDAKFVEATKVARVIDTTGAGDTFLGAVTTQIFAGQSLDEAIKFASVASSLAIQSTGASNSIPAYSKVKASLEPI